jgi:hypothetical protein
MGVNNSVWTQRQGQVRYNQVNCNYGGEYENRNKNLHGSVAHRWITFL